MAIERIDYFISETRTTNTNVIRAFDMVRFSSRCPSVNLTHAKVLAKKSLPESCDPRALFARDKNGTAIVSSIYVTRFKNVVLRPFRVWTRNKCSCLYIEPVETCHAPVPHVITLSSIPYVHLFNISRVHRISGFRPRQKSKIVCGGWLTRVYAALP